MLETNLQKDLKKKEIKKNFSYLGRHMVVVHCNPISFGNSRMF